MKKWTVLFFAVTTAISLTACSPAEKPSNTNAQTNGASEAAVVPTVEEMIEKTTKASADLKSFSMDSKVNQHMVMAQGEQKQEQNVEMAMKSDFVKEPVQMYQEIHMKMPQGEQAIKQYITNDGVFTEANGKWMKLPNEMKDQIMASMKTSLEPGKQMEQFKKIVKDTKVAVEGSDYVLSADLSGDNVKELAKELMSQAGGAGEQATAMLDSMNIKSLKIENAVNKDTYLPTRSVVNMSMEMEQEGQKIALDMEMTTTFSKHNEVSEIKVPEEALKAAPVQQ
ncbi:hypothetical protein BRE01_52280 [Brevibacillus reuszeri]|uniref:Lipoprotein n=1 Tax=Brevibacillus reuszeri TaxID=54915 RepID=A0A0K9YK19_9BACL|nr:DUF6612 family protein [Brevibacillus reuszeri]KNB69009.1 hypothetical protein ADS79_31300 [Brevibacillus reuszeri]MED1859360.1 hypothetical protein [Brevibacillus reuszeri]GED71526.1 hypothetical protein BRE01_52280 [Brevibacillus reuszeri]